MPFVKLLDSSVDLVVLDSERIVFEERLAQPYAS